MQQPTEKSEPPERQHKSAPHWNMGVCSHGESTFTISSLSSGQSVLTTTLELALQFQIAWPT